MFYKVDFVGDPIDYHSESTGYRAWLEWACDIFDKTTGMKVKRGYQNFYVNTDIGVMAFYFGGHHLEDGLAVLVYEAFCVMEGDLYIESFPLIQSYFDVFETSHSYIDSLDMQDEGTIYVQIKNGLPIKKYNYNSESDMIKCFEGAVKWFSKTAKKIDEILTPFGFVKFV